MLDWHTLRRELGMPVLAILGLCDKSVPELR